MIDFSANAPILMLGASGPCGQALLERLAGQGVSILAVSRSAPAHSATHVLWIKQDLDQGPVACEANVLISAGPLNHVLRQADFSPSLGRIIALSSASTEFKANSSDPSERELINHLIDLEKALIEVCKSRDISLTLLKPTMIYGGMHNDNVTRIGKLAEEFRWLPYCGRGLRHPVHADDLAYLMQDCLIRGESSDGVWLLGGGEALNYPAMMARIARAHDRVPRLIRLPMWFMKLMLSVAHRFHRLEGIRPVMLERQCMDLLVDDTSAKKLLDWEPRAFRP